MKTKIEAIRLDLTNSVSLLQKQVKVAFSKKVEQAAVAFVTWLLSKREVQRVIASKFEGTTPMCNVLTRAVESAVDEAMRNGHSVDADDVDGLSGAIESAIESAFSDMNFTDAVKDAIDLEEIAKSIDLSDLLEEHTEAIADGVAEVLARRLRGR